MPLDADLTGDTVGEPAGFDWFSTEEEDLEERPGNALREERGDTAEDET